LALDGGGTSPQRAAMGGAIRILIADDHTLVRESLVSLLQAAGDVQVVAQAADGLETVTKAIATRPDIVVTDIAMPRLNGIEVVRRLREALPEVRVLVLTMHQEDEYVLQAVRAGAAGYLVKDSAAEELIAAVRSLQAGRGYFGPQAAKALADQLQHPGRQVDDPYGRLTAREREVFHLIVEGLTTKEIARKLDISAKTAENHRARVLDKLDVRNTAELVRYALRKGLLD
jgi:DNA-binding NarL/FixJ family response regulator